MAPDRGECTLRGGCICTRAVCLTSQVSDPTQTQTPTRVLVIRLRVRLVIQDYCKTNGQLLHCSASPHINCTGVRANQAMPKTNRATTTTSLLRQSKFGKRLPGRVCTMQHEFDSHVNCTGVRTNQTTPKTNLLQQSKFGESLPGHICTMQHEFASSTSPRRDPGIKPMKDQAARNP